MTLTKAGELLALNRWIGKLPDEMIYQRPRLALYYVWGLIGAHQLDNARYWLDRIEGITIDRQPGEESPGAPVENAELRNIKGGLAICRSMLALTTGDVQQAADFSQAAIGYLPEDTEENPFLRSIVALEDSLYFTRVGDTSRAIETLRETARMARGANNLLVLVVATCELAEMQAMQGHLSQALVTLQKARFMAVGPDGNPLPLAGIVDNGSGEILRERDLLKEAREHLERGCRLTQAWWSLSSLEGMISLARVLQSQGDIDGSQALIAQASQLTLSTESSQWDVYFAAAVAARLALQRNDLAAAIPWLKKSGLLDETNRLQNLPYQVHEYLLLTQARRYLAIGHNSGDVGQLHQALDLLQSILPEVERLQRVTSKIEILALRSLTEYALGKTDQAVNTLSSALALGEPEDYRRIFLDEGRPMAELLARCRSAQAKAGGYLPSVGYIDGLLEAIGPAVDVTPTRPATREKRPGPITAKTEDDMPISLSAREMEVLKLIAEGKSNQEISAQLYLALNTVKRHAYNIYAKLEVKKRTHAVSKARQLGLIP
jgi:LuxR family maltose regulon positive regulatory protein